MPESDSLPTLHVVYIEDNAIKVRTAIEAFKDGPDENEEYQYRLTVLNFPESKTWGHREWRDVDVLLIDLGHEVTGALTYIRAGFDVADDVRRHLEHLPVGVISARTQTVEIKEALKAHNVRFGFVGDLPTELRKYRDLARDVYKHGHSYTYVAEGSQIEQLKPTTGFLARTLRDHIDRGFDLAAIELADEAERAAVGCGRSSEEVATIRERALEIYGSEKFRWALGTGQGPGELWDADSQKLVMKDDLEKSIAKAVRHPTESLKPCYTKGRGSSSSDLKKVGFRRSDLQKVLPRYFAPPSTLTVGGFPHPHVLAAAPN